MKARHHDKTNDQKSSLISINGKIYFTKELERRFYFFMTIIMLILGLLAKTGLF